MVSSGVVAVIHVAGVRCGPCGAMRWTVYGWSQVEFFSLNLTPIALPDCPIYALLHVLHFSSYIPLGSSCVGVLSIIECYV